MLNEDDILRSFERRKQVNSIDNDFRKAFAKSVLDLKQLVLPVAGFNCIKDLGVQFDCSLSFNRHIDYVVIGAFKQISFLVQFYLFFSIVWFDQNCSMLLSSVLIIGNSLIN